MSVGLQLEFDSDADLFAKRIQRMANANMPQMMDLVGGEVVAQTKTRIQEDKADPDGTPWEPWSEKYADSVHGRVNRHGPHPGSLLESEGHSLLELDGELVISIESFVSGDTVLVGSDKKYANRQNLQRQFLGLSDQDGEDIEALVGEFMVSLLR